MFFRIHTQTTPIFFICTALPKNCLLYELYSVTEPLITTTLWVQLFIQNISQSPGYFQAERTYPMWSQNYSWRSAEFSYASVHIQISAFFLKLYIVSSKNLFLSCTAKFSASFSISFPARLKKNKY